MRSRGLWICAGALALAALVTIPIRQRHHAQTRAAAVGTTTPPSLQREPASPKRDFKRTLSSAQVAERVALLETVSEAEEREFIETVLGIGNEHLDERRFAAAEAVADAILAIAPRNRTARELKEDASRAGFSTQYRDFLELRRERFGSSREDMEEGIPAGSDRNATGIHLTRSAWSSLIAWARNPLIEAPPLPQSVYRAKEAREDDEIIAIQHKLENFKIDLEFTDSSLYDIVDFIQEFAKINIVIAAEVRREGIPDRQISFMSHDRLLEAVLRDLLDQDGLDWTFENRVLLITTPLLAAGKPELRTYDIHDLVESGEWNAEEIQASLLEQIAPLSWHDRGGEVSMEIDGGLRLLITHVPKVQVRIGEHLRAIRRRLEAQPVEEFKELIRTAVQLHGEGRITEAREKVAAALRIQVDDRIVLWVRDEYPRETLVELWPEADPGPIINKGSR